MFRVFSRPRLAVACLLSVPLTAGIGACSHDTQGAMVVRTTEVASPDVAVTPDGTTLVFSLLGHLFQLRVDGGDAEQLTFGPFFDARPAVSPDGSTIAFQSDRDGSEGNTFPVGSRVWRIVSTD